MAIAARLWVAVINIVSLGRRMEQFLRYLRALGPWRLHNGIPCRANMILSASLHICTDAIVPKYPFNWCLWWVSSLCQMVVSPFGQHKANIGLAGRTLIVYFCRHKKGQTKVKEQNQRTEKKPTCSEGSRALTSSPLPLQQSSWLEDLSPKYTKSALPSYNTVDDLLNLLTTSKGLCVTRTYL
jgi:hypothetical protein